MDSVITHSDHRWLLTPVTLFILSSILYLRIDSPALWTIIQDGSKNVTKSGDDLSDESERNAQDAKCGFDDGQRTLARYVWRGD